MRNIFFTILVILLNVTISKAVGIFDKIGKNKHKVGLYQKFELSLSLNAKFKNPFNPEEVELQASFKSPSGRIKMVDGFYNVDFKIINQYGYLKKDTANWKIRFTPDEIGEWEYKIYCRDSEKNDSTEASKFLCIPSESKGFIRKSNTNYLKYDDSSQFFAIGENIGWYNNYKIYDYKKWIDALAANGGNYMRIWMCSWATAIEWKNTGLGDYSKRMDRAFELDWILEYASEKNIEVQICLNNHGQVSTYVNSEWNSNPYNWYNGGPCKNTWEFFTDTTAIKYYKQKLRYIIARWGYSPNILAWEIFNEIEYTNFFNTYKDDIIAWHKLNTDYILTLDVNHHLITTSLGYPHENHKLWELPGIDYTQTHVYTSAVDVESVLLNFTRDFLSLYNKPTLNGEFGLSIPGQWLNRIDSSGIHIHNVLWSSVISGSLGTAMTWWWDWYIDPNNLYYFYKPLSDFISSLDFISENFKPSDNIKCSTNQKSDLIFQPGFGAWSRSPENQFNIDREGITPAVTELGSFLFGMEWWNDGLRNPPVFSVNIEEPAKFVIIVGDTSEGSKISVKLDGKEIINESPEDSIYSISIPAGRHVVELDNPGRNFTRIAGYELTNSVTALKGFISRGKNTTIGWLHNRNYNWRNVRVNKNPQEIKSGTVDLTYLPNGLYKIELFDCMTGKLINSFEKEVRNNILSFDVNNVKWDLVFKIFFTGSKIPDVTFVPKKININYNRPVPSNSLIDIRYFVEHPSFTSISIYNGRGEFVQSITDSYLTPGMYSTVWNTKNLSPGCYLVRMTTGESKETEKIIVK